jgi:hypothetical protein
VHEIFFLKVVKFTLILAKYKVYLIIMGFLKDQKVIQTLILLI